MQATGVSTNLSVPDIESARTFYADFLGFSVEDFNLGWVVRLETPDRQAGVQLVSGDATAPVDSVASISVDDIDAAYREAQDSGFEIIHPLTKEPWGLRRFFVRAPDGNVFNIVNHRH